MNKGIVLALFFVAPCMVNASELEMPEIENSFQKSTKTPRVDRTLSRKIAALNTDQFLKRGSVALKLIEPPYIKSAAYELLKDQFFGICTDYCYVLSFLEILHYLPGYIIPFSEPNRIGILKLSQICSDVNARIDDIASKIATFKQSFAGAVATARSRK